MTFNFDDEDDDLNLGDTKPKMQKPAPLPKTAQVGKESLGKLPQPGQKPAPKPPSSLPKQPAPKAERTAPAKPEPSMPAGNPATPKPVKAVKKPPTEPTPIIKPAQPEPEVDDMYEESEIPSYVEESFSEPRVPVEHLQPSLNTSQGRRARSRATYVEDNQFKPESSHVLSKEESKRTIKKKNPFDGDRKVIKRFRILVSISIVFLMAAGVYSFVPKPGFKDDVSQINAAITYANKYDAIKTTAENYALRFTTDFLNRTEVTEATYKETMTTYMNEETLSRVSFELSALPSSTQPDGIKVYLKPIGGPWIHSINNIDAGQIQAQRINEGEGYIYSIVTSTYVQPYFLEGESPIKESALKPQWVYLSIPVMHDIKTQHTALYGYPSFYTPERTSGLDKFITPFEGADWPQKDNELSNNAVLKAQLEAFLQEWSKQSPNQKVSPDLKTLLASDANPRAEKGLAGKYTNAKDETIITAIDVKPLEEGDKVTSSTVREALVTVKWVDNSELLETPTYVPAVYTQQYLIDFKGASDKWQIVDIRARYSEK